MHAPHTHARRIPYFSCSPNLAGACLPSFRLTPCTTAPFPLRYVDVEEEETTMISMFISDLRLARQGEPPPYPAAVAALAGHSPADE